MDDEEPKNQPETEAIESIPEVIEPSSVSSKHCLDPRIVQVWKLENCIGLGLLLVGTLAASIALVANTEAPAVLMALICLIVLTIFLLQVFWFPQREYERWSYEMTDQILELRFGVIWQKAVLIPLSRLQHVDLHCGPLERHFGLSSLEIHTAGTKNATHKIPGLLPDTATQLRDDLVKAAQIESA